MLLLVIHQKNDIFTILNEMSFLNTSLLTFNFCFVHIYKTVGIRENNLMLQCYSENENTVKMLQLLDGCLPLGKAVAMYK